MLVAVTAETTNLIGKYAFSVATSTILERRWLSSNKADSRRVSVVFDENPDYFRN